MRICDALLHAGDSFGRMQGSQAASLAAAAAAAAASSEVPVDVGGVLQVPIAFVPDTLQVAEAQLSISVAPATAGPEGTQGGGWAAFCFVLAVGVWFPPKDS
eukprot:1157628-Pelagomonas_calceolata.AAC.5